METVPVTFATHKEFTEKEFRLHAGLLADKIESLPPRFHKQNSWVESPRNNECGTTGCALGIAALSHIIPGLQFKIRSSSSFSKYFRVVPTANGKNMRDPDMPWNEAGKRFFGTTVTNRIFLQPDLSRANVIAKLRSYATTGYV